MHVSFHDLVGAGHDIVAMGFDAADLADLQEELADLNPDLVAHQGRVELRDSSQTMMSSPAMIGCNRGEPGAASASGQARSNVHPQGSCVSVEAESVSEANPTTLIPCTWVSASDRAMSNVDPFACVLVETKSASEAGPTFRVSDCV